MLLINSYLYFYFNSNISKFSIISNIIINSYSSNNNIFNNCNSCISNSNW